MDPQIKRIQLAGELFEAVQKKGIFSDCKQFVDMIPKDDPERILRLWEKLKDEPIFDLKTFILTYFEQPEEFHQVLNIKRKKVTKEHIQFLWNELFRKPDKAVSEFDSLIPLPHPYVVSGGSFREVYYWDSYFIAQGLRADGHEHMILNMVRNFNHLIHKFGFIPAGNRVYLTDRSQPPFYVPLADMAINLYGDDLIAEVLPVAEQEYNFWMDNSNVKGSRSVQLEFEKRQGLNDEFVVISHNLNRYWSERIVPRQESWSWDLETGKNLNSSNQSQFFRKIRAASESGWDFSSRWTENGNGMGSLATTDILPVDLNTLLWVMERKISKWNSKLGNDEKSRKFEKKAYQRKKSIFDLMWSNADGFFFDYNFQKKEQTNSWSLAALYPLYFGMATKDQAAKVAVHLERKFLKKGGLVSTLKESGMQWDAPYGWAPMQWMAVVGLKKYGFESLANEISRRWRELNDRVFQQTGKMVEKYNVLDLDQEDGGGNYPFQDGYGWTNSVYSALDEMAGD
jgi:alpha,alpha-trehalase